MEESFILQLPDEKLQEICQKLDDKSLGRLIRSSSRFRSACQEVLDARLTYEQKLTIKLARLITTFYQDQDSLISDDIRFLAINLINIDDINEYLEQENLDILDIFDIKTIYK